MPKISVEYTEEEKKDIDKMTPEEKIHFQDETINAKSFLLSSVYEQPVQDKKSKVIYKIIKTDSKCWRSSDTGRELDKEIRQAYTEIGL